MVVGDRAEGEGFGLWGKLKERKSEVPVVVVVAGVVELRPASKTGSVSGLDSGSEGPLNKKREVERNEGLRCESVTVVVMSLQRKTPRRFFLVVSCYSNFIKPLYWIAMNFGERLLRYFFILRVSNYLSNFREFESSRLI